MIDSAANSGTTTSKMALKGSFTLSSDLFNRDIVETYIPIKSNDDEVIAVFGYIQTLQNWYKI